MTDFWDQWDVQLREEREKAGFDPDQPRDRHGRWTRTGRIDRSPETPAGFDQTPAMPYKEMFKTKEEAIDWLTQNLAKDVKVDPSFGVGDLNSITAPLRVVMERAPLAAKINDLNIERTFSGAYGSFVQIGLVGQPGSGSRSINLYYDSLNSLAARTDKQKIEDYIQHMENGIYGVDKKIETIQARTDASEEYKKQEITRLTKIKDNALAKLNPIKAGNYDAFFGQLTALSYDSIAGGVAVHEYGHAWHYEHVEEVAARFKLYPSLDIQELSRVPEMSSITKRQYNSQVKKLSPSAYGRKNFAEAFAESFSLYHVGKIERLHPDFIKYFDEVFPDLDWGHKKRKEIYDGK